jgi:uncharacterized protein YdhG (YjbR/CyaY superfamily)
MNEDFPPKIGAPATRALANAGITSAQECAEWTEAQLADLHGMGPKALSILRASLGSAGLSFSEQAPGNLKQGGSPIDDYLSALPEPQRLALQRLREQLREILPEAEEGIRYGVPAFSLNGKGVAGFGAATHHLSYYPMSGSVLESAGEHVAKFEVSKGRLIFQPKTPIPKGLLRRLVSLRLKELR